MIDFRDIRFGIGNAQDEGRDLSKSVIPFDASQNLTAVHLGHVEIEQNNIGTGRAGMVPLLLQEGYCLNAIASHVHMERVVDPRKASCNSLTSPALSSTKSISKGMLVELGGVLHRPFDEEFAYGNFMWGAAVRAFDLQLHLPGLA